MVLPTVAMEPTGPRFTPTAAPLVGFPYSSRVGLIATYQRNLKTVLLSYVHTAVGSLFCLGAVYKSFRSMYIKFLGPLQRRGEKLREQASVICDMWSEHCDKNAEKLRS